MEERRNDIKSTHNISITEREKILVSGVLDVESFDENEIILYTSEGGIVLNGEEFKINKLNVDNGEVEINGYLNELKYVNTSSGSTTGFWSKIFK